MELVCEFLSCHTAELHTLVRHQFGITHRLIGAAIDLFQVFDRYDLQISGCLTLGEDDARSFLGAAQRTGIGGFKLDAGEPQAHGICYLATFLCKRRVAAAADKAAGLIRQSLPVTGEIDVYRRLFHSPILNGLLHRSCVGGLLGTGGQQHTGQTEYTKCLKQTFHGNKPPYLP